MKQYNDLFNDDLVVSYFPDIAEENYNEFIDSINDKEDVLAITVSRKEGSRVFITNKGIRYRKFVFTFKDGFFSNFGKNQNIQFIEIDKDSIKQKSRGILSKRKTFMLEQVPFTLLEPKAKL